MELSGTVFLIIWELVVHLLEQFMLMSCLTILSVPCLFFY